MLPANGGIPDQSNGQQPMMASQPTMAQLPPPPDMATFLAQKKAIILDISERPEMKEKALLMIKEKYEDVYKEEQTSFMAQSAVAIIQSLFKTTRPGFSDDNIYFRIRKLALEFVIRFVPLDAYKAHTSDFEDQLCNAVYEENEAMALMILKYFIDYLKVKRVGSMANFYFLLDRLRSCIKFIIAACQRDTVAFFCKPQFTAEVFKSEAYMMQIIEGLHFELPVKLAKNPVITIWPKSKHSVKLILEVVNLEVMFLIISKERRQDESSEDIIRTFIDFINLDISEIRAIADFDFLATFYDVQIKCLTYFPHLMKVRDQSPNVLNYFRQCTTQIADAFSLLLKKSVNTLPSTRKEMFFWLKQVLMSDLRIEHIEVLPVLCYDEILIGSFALVSSQTRSDLFGLKAELFHAARPLITWTTFQLLVMISLRDSMDYTLTPACQQTYAKLLLQFLDLCQKVAECKNPQLSVAFTYDSARSMYESVFQIICKKVNVLSQKSVREILIKANRWTIDKENFPEEDDDSEDLESDEVEDMVMKECSMGIDRFDEDSSDDEAQETFLTVAMKKISAAKLEKASNLLAEKARSGSNLETTKSIVKAAKRQMGSSSFATFENLLPGSSFLSKDARLKMLWLDRKPSKMIDIQPELAKIGKTGLESTFVPPQEFPYLLPEVKSLFKHYTLVLKSLITTLHSNDDLRSNNPSITHFRLLNTLFTDFLMIFELNGIGYYPDETPKTKPQYITPLSVDDKEIVDNFLAIYSYIHPAVFERILANHIAFIHRRSMVSMNLFQVLMSMHSAHVLQLSVSLVYLEYLMKNVDLIFVMDEEDHMNGFPKLIKILLNYIVCILPIEPHTLGFVSKIQSFVFEIVMKSLNSILHSADHSIAVNVIKIVFRHCGIPQGQPLYKIFLPLFPSFLQWFSLAQNVTPSETLQDILIEMCLSLPARLSSLVPFMPLLSDPIINSLQNINAFNAQGLRTVELCLDNYSSHQIKDFFGNNYSRLHEQLWVMASSVDQGLSQQAIKLIGKLSAMNRNAICDTQRLMVKNKLPEDNMVLKMKFERSGKCPDSLIKEQLQYEPFNDNKSDYIEVSQYCEELFGVVEFEYESKPLMAQLPIQSIIATCSNIVRHTITNENGMPRGYFYPGRAESAFICYEFFMNGFNTQNFELPEEDGILKPGVVLNNIIINKSRDLLNGFCVKQCAESMVQDNHSCKQSFVDALAGILFASTNRDMKDHFEQETEAIIDSLTLQLHLESGFRFFGIDNLPNLIGCFVDGSVLMDVICQIFADRFVKLHSVGCVVLLRVIQTAMSFDSDPSNALNIPMFHFLANELAKLCSQSFYLTRIGGISGLEVLVENLPLNFIIAKFDTLFDACLSILQFADDDITKISQETAVNVYKMLLDKTMDQSVNSQFGRDVTIYLSNVVKNNLKTGSIWVAEMLSEVLFVLKIQSSVPRSELFSYREVNSFLDWHYEEFAVGCFESKIVQLKIVCAFLRCVEQPIKFTESAKKYLPLLLFSYIYTNEELVTSPNYQKVPVNAPFGTNCVPSSLVLKYDNGINFWDRLKSYRSIAAEASTCFCVSLIESDKTLKINPDIDFSLKNFIDSPPTDSQSAVDAIFGMHIFVVRVMQDSRQDLSISAVTILSQQCSSDSRKGILEKLLQLVKESSENAHLLKLVDALIISKEDCFTNQVEQLLIPENLYEPIYDLLSQYTKLDKVHLECLTAFLNIFRKCDLASDERLLNGLLEAISQEELVHLYDSNKFDVYGIVITFFQSQKSDYCLNYLFSYFLSVNVIVDATKREAFLRLISHKEACLLKSTILNFEATLIHLLTEHQIKLADGTEQKLKVADFGMVDEFVLRIIFECSKQYPNWFSRNTKLAAELRLFLLGNYFRGNYALRDHGLDNSNRLRLTYFPQWKFQVPEILQVLLIKFYMKNVHRFDILLALCTFLPQSYFCDNDALRKLVSNFLAPRMTLIWTKKLFKFSIEKLKKILDSKPDSPNDKDEIARYHDAQIYLGYFFLYVMNPCLTEALQRFPSDMVLDTSTDHFMKKRRWKRSEICNRVQIDLAKVFCDDILSRIHDVRPELAHGAIQCGTLLMQRAAVHIHPIGSRQQSQHLQRCMQVAWPSLSGTGIYADRGLRSVAQFFLASVMNAVYIKKDIVYQHFDSLMANVDNRDNQIVQNALDTVTHHVVFGRKDDCVNGFVERIRDYMIADGFNMIKVGNILHMLSRNYEDLFSWRHALAPTIVQTLMRIPSFRGSIYFYIDGFEAIIGWEEILQKKISEINEEAYDLEEENAEEKALKKAAILKSPELKSFDLNIADTVSALLTKLTVTSWQEQKETDRNRKLTNLFQRALNPQIFCRSMCIRIERLLMPRETTTQQQKQQFASQCIATIRVLGSVIISCTPESVYQLALCIQNCLLPCVSLKHRAIMDTVVSLIIKIFEQTKEFSPTEQNFGPIFSALEEYCTSIGNNFNQTLKLQDVSLLITAMKTICTINDAVFQKLCGPSYIAVLANVVKTLKMIPQTSVNLPVEQGADKKNFDVLVNGMEVFQQKAAITSEEIMSLYLKNVVFPLLTQNETLPGKILEVCCKTVEESIKTRITRFHVSVIGAITRHHTSNLMRHVAASNSFFSIIAYICGTKGLVDNERDEIVIPFYHGLNVNDSELRGKFLDIFENKLPKKLFERLCFLLAFESWQLVNFNAIIPIIVEMLLRCLKGIDFKRDPPKSLIRSEYYGEIAPIVEPVEVAVEDQAELTPVCSFYPSIHALLNLVSCKEKNSVENWLDYLPEPCEPGTFKNCEINYKPLKLDTLLKNYHDFLEGCNNRLQKRFPEMMIGVMSILMQEPELAGNIFIDLFTSLWSSFTEYERSVVTELMGHFLQMPVFSLATASVVRPFWQAISKCNPPMKFDKLKIVSSPCGVKHVHYSIVAAEKELATSVNLVEVVSELRTFYKSIDEFDMFTRIWKLLDFTPKSWKTHFLYNQSCFDLALEETPLAQDEIVSYLNDGDEIIDDVTVFLKTAHDCLTEVALMAMKQKNDWERVAEFAKENSFLPVLVEADFHLASKQEHWLEINELLKDIANIDDPTMGFTCTVYRLLYLMSSFQPQVIADDNYQEKLYILLTERFRRLPYLFSPKHIEVLRDCTLIVDVLDAVLIAREIFSQRDIVAVIDGVIKSTIMLWRFRNISKADSPSESIFLLRFRLTLLWMINQQITVRKPELKDINSANYTLTPMHNVSEHVQHISKVLQSFGNFKEAKKELSVLANYAGLLNTYDCCSLICEMIRCTMNQCENEPTSITKDELSKETTAFLNADVEYFKPDAMAFYAAVRGQVFDFLGEKTKAMENFRIAIKLESTFDDKAQNPMSPKIMKTIAKHLYKENCLVWNETGSIYAIQSIFELLIKTKNPEVEKVSDLIHVMKKYIFVGKNLEILDRFVVLYMPKLSVITFLPFLQEIVVEVLRSKSRAFGSILVLMHEVFPVYVAHAILLEVGFNDFYNVVGKVKKTVGLATDMERINKDIQNDAENVETYKLTEFPIFKSISESLAAVTMEQLVRCHKSFQDWKKLNLNDFRNGRDLLLHILEKIGLTVPSEIVAFAEVVKGFETMEKSVAEKVLLEVYKLCNQMIADEGSVGPILNSIKALLEKPDAKMDKFQPISDATLKMVNFLTEAAETHEKFAAISNIAKKLEDFIQKYHSEQHLKDISPILYHFTNQKAKLPNFSSFFDYGSGLCIPNIEVFDPLVKVYARFGVYYRMLNVRLSNGKIVSYILEETPADLYLKSPFKALNCFNVAVENFRETNRRGALFRIPNIFQLSTVRLVDVRAVNVNKFSKSDNLVKPMANILYDKSRTFPEIHPFDQLADYHCLKYQGKDSVEALKEIESKVNSSRLHQALADRYDDPTCLWYVRKSLATQFALHSILEHIFDLAPIRYENLLFDFVYGRLWNLRPVFQKVNVLDSFKPSETKLIPFRMTPTMVDFLGLSLEGHFAATFTAMASCLLKENFATYLKPFYWDLFMRIKHDDVAKKHTYGDVTEIEKDLDFFTSKLKEITQNLDIRVFELIETATNRENLTQGMDLSQSPWL